jgi:hypothetical protein
MSNFERELLETMEAMTKEEIINIVSLFLCLPKEESQ